MAYRYWILALLSLSTMINYLDRQALSVIVPTLRKEMSLSSADYGSITTAFMLAYGVGQILAGAVVDRLGTRLGLAIFVFIWSVAAAAHSWASSVAALFFLRIALGLGEAGNWPAGVKAVSEWFPKSERAFSMGIFDGGSALGAILAPPLIAWLTISFGWRTSFLATASLGFVWLLGWLLFYKEGPAAAPHGKGVSSVWVVLDNPQLWGLMAMRTVSTPVWWFYVFWLPDYLGKGRGLSLKEIGLFGWVPYVTVDFGKLVGGRLSDRLIGRGFSTTTSRRAVMAGGALFMACGLFVVAANSVEAALTLVSLATFGFGMWSANTLALHADLFPSSQIASATGWTTAASSVGGAAFTWLTGRLVDTHGYGVVFALAGSAALVAFAVLWFGVGKIADREALA